VEVAGKQGHERAVDGLEGDSQFVGSVGLKIDLVGGWQIGLHCG